ncbi:MAG: FecR domain-containing protein [Lentisphaeraceae bacterium]|nr:FecR domain-containing protein [Lentisphaeraceae bacterium]
MTEEELFDRYLTASITADEQEQLKGLLKEDSEAGDRLSQHITETAMYVSIAEDFRMYNVFETKKPVRFNTNRITQNNIRVASEKPQRKLNGVFLAGIAATILFGGLIFAQFVSQNSIIGTTSDVASVRIERTAFDLGLNEPTVIRTGDRVTALEDMELSLNDNSKLMMTRGSSILLTRDKAGFKVDQFEGLIQYKIDKQKNGKTFHVLTNGLRTSVIGTEFTVDSDSTKEKVRVLEGLVKVDNKADKSFFVNPGEFAFINQDEASFDKKSAVTGMKLNEMVQSFAGEDLATDQLEEKPLLMILYAEKWDPSSRSFIHKLKNLYKEYNQAFEVVFMNNIDDFAQDYEMPWSIVKSDFSSSAESLLNVKKSSYPLSVTLVDQNGITIARSVSGNKWLGTSHLIDTIKSNSK